PLKKPVYPALTIPSLKCETHAARAVINVHIYQACLSNHISKKNGIITQPAYGASPVFRPNYGVKVTSKDNLLGHKRMGLILVRRHRSCPLTRTS
ncbi:unnamed protein product, partial [Staurois parvus]